MRASPDERRLAPNGEINIVYFIFKNNIISDKHFSVTFSKFKGFGKKMETAQKQVPFEFHNRLPPRAKVCPLWLKCLGFH